MQRLAVDRRTGRQVSRTREYPAEGARACGRDMQHHAHSGGQVGRQVGHHALQGLYPTGRRSDHDEISVRRGGMGDKFSFHDYRLRLAQT